jgi:hypothetical protein
MNKIEHSVTIPGYAWVDEDSQINWATREDMQDVKIEERPAGCTPVVIEITPAEEWVERQRKDRDFLGNLVDQVNQFTTDLHELEKAFKVRESK